LTDVAAALSGGLLYFEELAVGQRRVVGPLPAVASHPHEDGDGVPHAGKAEVEHSLYRTSAQSLGALTDPLSAIVTRGFSSPEILRIEWQFLAPIAAADALRIELTITQCRPSSSKREGLVHRHVRVLNERDTVVQEGVCSFTVASREAKPAARPALDFCSPAWGAELGRLLQDSEEFRACTGSFDGTIGFVCGQEELQLRIYRGTAIEITPRTPSGATFAISAPEIAWVELATGSRNDYIARATRGEFRMTGNVFEYLRMTRAVVILWDLIRLLAQDGHADRR
jgi:hypothetical protein